MATDHIRYDLLARDALRGVLRRVLTDAAEHGLPGRASFLHHLLSDRRRREAVAAAAGAISGRDDDHPPAPVLGSGGDRGSLRGRPVVRRHSGAAGGSVQRDQELLRSVGAVRPAVRAVRCRDRGVAAETCRPSPAPSAVAGSRAAASRRRAPRTSRPSRARAPRSCGWIASARNNPVDARPSRRQSD